MKRTLAMLASSFFVIAMIMSTAGYSQTPVQAKPDVQVEEPTKKLGTCCDEKGIEKKADCAHKAEKKADCDKKKDKACDHKKDCCKKKDKDCGHKKDCCKEKDKKGCDHKVGSKNSFFRLFS
ncbi:MAG TPA: hypothetical protein VLH16_02935 [Bacteroidales bacterium]|nr:hypothetical protein [Bacteroidales bacterium]